MTQITHEQARTLLQFAADGQLDSASQVSLAAHLEGCAVCRSYAGELEKLETSLKAAMQKRWNVGSPSAAVERILNSRKHALSFQRALPFAATPLVVALAVMFLIFFARWQVVTGGSTSTPLPTPTAVTAPMPPLQLTTARVSPTACNEVVYIVQPDDTLESIANKFGVPVEAIREANSMSIGEALTDRIIVPVCGQTPSRTPTITLAFTATPPILLTSRTP